MATTVHRRQLLRIGGAGLFGLSLPQFLRLRQAGAAYGELRDVPAESCIFIVVSGGLSHLDTLDPKPRASSEIRSPYPPISTTVPGVQVTDMLPRLARQMHRCTLIRSLSHAEVPHVTAAHMMLSGQMDGSRKNQTPFMGSLISKFRPASASMPSYVWLHNMKTGTNKVPRYDNGLHMIGYGHAPMRVGYELDNPTSPEFRVRTFDPAEGVSPERMSERFDLLGRVEAGELAVRRSPAGEQFDDFHHRARDMVSGPEARQAFDLSREPEAVRERYGRHPIGQYLLMARRLVEAGVRLATVTAWPGLAPGETEPTITQVWDMHDIRYAGNESMFGDGPFGFRWSLPRLDQGVAALIEDLDERGMLETTLVVVLSEFGRTPKFEGKGRGRGHWPNCYSAILAGGGAKRGFVHGASDKQGAFVETGPAITPLDFGATLFDALGIPPETRYGPDGFSLRVSDGEPVRELFG